MPITYRTFHNTDPPRLVELWNQSGLGRAAAGELTVDAFEFFVFAQSYFDSKGLILACEDKRVVGFAHAAPAVADDNSRLCSDSGSVVALLVHPDFRRQGIGTELLQRARAYLNDRGISRIELGPGERSNGFYLGIYGGVQPFGFRDSDGPFDPFAEARGWQPTQKILCYQKDLSAQSRDPVNMKLVANRRKTRLNAVDACNDASWWWMTRFGRMDSVEFQLVGKSDETVLARSEIFGLDLYIPKWGQRAAGLRGVTVAESHEGNAYELSLLLEMGKYLREQLITVIDTSVDAADQQTASLLETAGFELCDTGTIYGLS